MTIEIENVHKTYLLGVEGVPALRYGVLKILRKVKSIFFPFLLSRQTQ